jgi:hypothetical protein
MCVIFSRYLISSKGNVLMKKMMMLIVTTALLLSGQVFAATEITSEVFIGGSAVGQSFSPSNNVTISVDVHPQNGYVIYSWHSSGSRRFGADSNTNNMYWRVGTNLTNRSLTDHIGANYVWPAPWAGL